MRIKQKIILLTVGSGLLVAIVAIVLLFTQRSNMTTVINEEIDVLTKDYIAQISEDVYGMVAAMDEAVQARVNYSLNVARDILKRNGGVSPSSRTVSWDAVNQYTKNSTPVTLPYLNLGSQRINKVGDFSQRALVVDEVAELVGGTATIFQRMNPSGDMLRIATNVKKLDGTRAIGTYIPAVNPDGQPNPVVSTVLRGQTYTGRAFVVNKWYLTAYEPLFDASGDVIGILYVGIPQEDVKSLRQAVMNITVGKTGYVFVLGGSGSIKGDYIISKDGARDGENIWEAVDANGNKFIQEMIEKAVVLKDGEIDFHYYPWKNKGEDVARMKVSALAYYAPWDWVIGAGAYEDDFFAVKNRVEGTFRSAIWFLVIALTLVTAILIGVAFYLGTHLVRPLERIVERLKDIAQGEGDLTVSLEVHGRDETAEVALGFNTFVEKIRGVIAPMKVQSGSLAEISELVVTATEQLASGSEEQQAQLSEISTTMEQTSTMVLETSRQTETTKESAQQANDLANQGIDTIQQTLTGSEQIGKAIDGATSQIDNLKKRSDDIGAVIQVIDEIADQTNLLALNANIEAARAGDAGRGFAVVADEVRKLAERTMTATSEISREISAMQADVNGVVEVMNTIHNESSSSSTLVQEASAAMTGITTAVNEVNAAMVEIAAAAEEQSAGIEEVSRNLEGITTVSKDTANSSQSLAEAGETLARSVTEIKSLINQFKVD